VYGAWHMRHVAWLAPPRIILRNAAGPMHDSQIDGKSSFILMRVGDEIQGKLAEVRLLGVVRSTCCASSRRATCGVLVIHLLGEAPVVSAQWERRGSDVGCRRGGYWVTK
jgi:hypothetical protein